MEEDTEKYIRKLKRKIWVLRIIILLIIAVVVSSIAVGYFYIKPYVEKFNELVVQFQNVRPYLNQITQSPIVSQDIKSAINNFEGLQPTLEKIQNFLNMLPK
jgi:predicted PurR-regulated permease PerM